MLVNKIIPMEVKERVCVHAQNNTPTYLLAEKGQGKTTETIRQAVFRKATILSTEADFYRSCGMKHVSEAKQGEVSFLGLGDVFNEEFKLNTQEREIHVCIDNAKKIIEELLSERFGVDIVVDFMSIEV